MADRLPPAGEPDAAVAEWMALLDRFEQELGRGLDDDLAAASGAAGPAWAPAATPLPAELRDRAQDVADRQRTRIRQLQDARDEAAAHLAALQRVPAAPADRPAYLDVDG